MAAGLLGGIFGGGKKSSSTAASTSSGATSGPIIKQLDPNDPLRRKAKGGNLPEFDPRSRIATILSDKLGN